MTLLIVGKYVWENTGKAPSYTNWWTFEFIEGKEPNRNGQCVFKDSYKDDEPEQFGWADYPCEKDSWSHREIHALCKIPKNKEATAAEKNKDKTANASTNKVVRKKNKVLVSLCFILLFLQEQKKQLQLPNPKQSDLKTAAAKTAANTAAIGKGKTAAAAGGDKTAAATGGAKTAAAAGGNKTAALPGKGKTATAAATGGAKTAAAAGAGEDGTASATSEDKIAALLQSGKHHFH